MSHGRKKMKGGLVSFVFDPMSLFDNGEIGTILEVNTSMMFQDTAGLVPAISPGDPVALVLDSSQGVAVNSLEQSLGPELSTPTSGAFGSGDAVNLTQPARIGARHLLTYTISASDFTGDLFLRPAIGPFAYQVLDKTPGTHSYLVTAEDTQTGYLRFGGNNPTGSITFDSISVREMLGNHAVQDVNDDFRPTLENDGQSYLSHDQIDDRLTIALPDLGGDVTEFYADETGVTITLGQTVGAGLRDLPTPNRLYYYGLVARALTTSETDQLTEYLNRKRGV